MSDPGAPTPGGPRLPLAPRASAAAARVRAAFAAGDPPLTNHIDWAHDDLATLVFAFRADADLERARAAGLLVRIEAAARAGLREAGCTDAEVAAAVVSFVSEEEVDRRGGPWIYFK